MMISDIRLQNFRSYFDDSFEFESGVNIIVGPNASGKTNLIEAILMLCQGSSYRARDVEMVRYEEPWARLEAYVNARRTLKLMRQDGGLIKKEFLIDDQVIRRLSLKRSIPAVLFEPDHLQLLKGSPEKRRDYFDDLVEQTVAGYGVLRRQYKRTLSQRNALLKHGPGSLPQLFAWNIRLSELGGQIVRGRIELIGAINEKLSGLYSSIAKRENKVILKYQSSCGADQYGSSMLKKLEQSEELDYTRGFTVYGPHRDDIVFNLNGRLASETASRGEARTLLLALKITELELIEKVRGQKPVLLLDDVFSELDGTRRRALTGAIAGYQTFITTTDADIVVQHFMNKCNIIPLLQ